MERLGRQPLIGTASTVDLSEGGVRLITPAIFEVGDVVQVIVSRGDVVAENQGLVVARQEGPDGVVTLNIGFRQGGERQLVALRRLMDCP